MSWLVMRACMYILQKDDDHQTSVSCRKKNPPAPLKQCKQLQNAASIYCGLLVLFTKSPSLKKPMDLMKGRYDFDGVEGALPPQLEQRHKMDTSSHPWCIIWALGKWTIAKERHGFCSGLLEGWDSFLPKLHFSTMNFMISMSIFSCGCVQYK